MSRKEPWLIRRIFMSAKQACRVSGGIITALTCSLASPSAAESSLSQTIDQVRPSIVMIGAFLKTASPQFTLLGTGFAVADNLIATNAHVTSALYTASPSAQLVVRSHHKDGTEETHAALLISSDPTHDLSVLRIDGRPLPKLRIGDSNMVKEGLSIAFSGFPIGGALGFSPVTHRGIVSAITSIAPPGQRAQELNPQRIHAIRSGSFQVFQLDATAYPGNSGGPLYHPSTGEVLGIINMVFVKGAKESALSAPSGISYAIPSKYLTLMLETLEASHKQSSGDPGK